MLRRLRARVQKQRTPRLTQQARRLIHQPAAHARVAMLRPLTQLRQHQPIEAQVIKRVPQHGERCLQRRGGTQPRAQRQLTA
jgi:hypothetical protein